MRIRSVKPEFWKDERLLALPRDARLLYIALWNEADDQGRLRARRDYLRGQLFPCDPGPWFDKALDALIAAGRVVTYDADGFDYAYIPRFTDHQRVNRPTASRIPAPPDVVSPHGALTDDSLSAHGGLTPSRARAGREQGSKGAREQGSKVEDGPFDLTTVGGYFPLIATAWHSEMVKRDPSRMPDPAPDGIQQVAEWAHRRKLTVLEVRSYIAKHAEAKGQLRFLPGAADRYDLGKPATEEGINAKWAGRKGGRVDL